ncbi:transporter substrate-binding domain-containing protein [Solibacillus sp. FSL H8-0538]|uniref:transporter substrate-binding domain-containing protein n=1 Tax=Solibacillus sp. FSL H8-0538 TaxID=2921400 RepID=UPI0030F8E459
MNFKQLGKFLAVGFASVTILAACGNTEDIDTTSSSKDVAANENETANAESTEVASVKVAFAQAAKPITYVDENGNATGYDVEVMKLVDEKLEDYEFEYIPTTDDDLFIGVEQGKYDVGVKNAFFTEERTKKFLFPEEFIGLSSAGLLLKSDKTDINNLSDFASKKLSLAPIAASSAQYTIIEEYNTANPNNQVNLVAGDEFNVDIVQWVNEGRVDGGITIEAIFSSQVTDEDGPYHSLINDVVYKEFAVIKTWPLFNKQQKEFAAAYDEAIAELKETDALRKLAEEFYGKDLFQLLDQANR